MERWKRFLAVSLVVCGVIVAGCGGVKDGDGSPGAKSADGEKVKVGLLNSLSGSMAISETAVRDAERLAIEEINAAGGVLGKQVEIVEEDGASEPEIFAEKARRLITNDKVVSIFGCWTSSARKAVLPVVEEENSLLWYPVQYEGMEESKNIVYLGSTINQQVVPAISYLVDSGKKKMFLVGSDYVYPHIANKAIKAQLAAEGVECVGEDYTPIGYDDFGEIIDSIEESGADVIINTLNGESNIAFFMQLKERGIEAATVPVMSFSIAEPEIKEIGASYVKGNLITWSYYETNDNPENKKFVAAYKKRYGGGRVTSAPIETAYTAVYLWKAAAEKAGSFKADDLRRVLGEVELDTPEGKVRFDGKTQNLYKEARIGKITENGDIETVEVTAPIRPDPYLAMYEWAKSLNK